MFSKPYVAAIGSGSPSALNHTIANFPYSYGKANRRTRSSRLPVTSRHRRTDITDKCKISIMIQNSNQLQNGAIFSNISCFNAIVCIEFVTIFSFAVKFDGYLVTCPLLLGALDINICVYYLSQQRCMSRRILTLVPVPEYGN